MSMAKYAIEDSIAMDSTILIEYSDECYNELLAMCDDYREESAVTRFWGIHNGMPWQVDVENEC